MKASRLWETWPGQQRKELKGATVCSRRESAESAEGALRERCVQHMPQTNYKWNEKGAKDGLLSFIISEELPREIKMKAIGQQVIAPMSTSPCFGAGRKRETI